MMKMIAADSDDVTESHNLQNGEINANISQSPRGRTAPNRARKFLVSFVEPTTESFHLRRRGHRKISKFQKPDIVAREDSFPELSTTQPKVIEVKRFTVKQHNNKRMDVLIERSNFHKKRIQNKFNHLNTEEKPKMTETNKIINSEHPDNHIQNVTDIDASIEKNSDEPKETTTKKVPLRRRKMKAAASEKVKTIAAPPFINVNTQRNYRIRSLLKNHRYNPRAERKMVPVLALQRGNGAIIGGQNDKTTSKNIEASSIKNNYLSPEENADQNEFIFLKEGKLKSTTSREDEEIVTGDPLFV